MSLSVGPMHGLLLNAFSCLEIEIKTHGGKMKDFVAGEWVCLVFVSPQDFGRFVACCSYYCSAAAAMGQTVRIDSVAHEGDSLIHYFKLSKATSA